MEIDQEAESFEELDEKMSEFLGKLDDLGLVCYELEKYWGTNNRSVSYILKELSNLDKINKSISELLIYLEQLMPIIFPQKVTFVGKLLPIIRIIKIGKASWVFIIKLSEIWKS